MKQKQSVLKFLKEKWLLPLLVLLVDCDFIKTQYGMNKEEMSC